MDRILTLHFIDGTKLSLEFPRQAELRAARQLKFSEILASKQLIVECEGSVLMVPVTSIKYASVSMADVPQKEIVSSLPRTALLGARIRS
jgi:hypothetical protein